MRIGDVTVHFNHYYLIPICQYHHITKLLQIQYNNPTLYKGRHPSWNDTNNWHFLCCKW